MSNPKGFNLISENIYFRLGIKCSDRTFISEEYGKKLMEVRGIQNNKLYFVAISDYGNFDRALDPIKTLSIGSRFSLGSDNSIAVLEFKAIIPSTELELFTLNHYRYRGIFDNTIRCLNVLNDYYKGLIGSIRYE